MPRRRTPSNAEAAADPKLLEEIAELRRRAAALRQISEDVMRRADRLARRVEAAQRRRSS
jgi:hypothetical protein